MKLMTCPMNGTRNIAEFVCLGEVKAMPDPANGSDREWAEYLFMEDNAKGVIREWWMHAPSVYCFIAERDTGTDEIVATYPPERLFAAGSRQTRGKELK